MLIDWTRFPLSAINILALDCKLLDKYHFETFGIKMYLFWSFVLTRETLDDEFV